jgi:hypothetical protein
MTTTQKLEYKKETKEAEGIASEELRIIIDILKKEMEELELQRDIAINSLQEIKDLCMFNQFHFVEDKARVALDKLLNIK